MIPFIGIDGCRKGWIVAILSESTCSNHPLKLELSLIDSIQSIAFLPNSTIWIDIPIGLSENSVRECDSELRKALGKKRASAFETPVKDAVFASTYAEASQLNHSITGKKISIQSWNICPKIKEVNQFLYENEPFKTQFFESHPELLFELFLPEYFLSKKSPEGFKQRIHFLNEKIGCIQIVNDFLAITKRSECNPDDILDAIILAYSAWLGSKNGTLFLGNPQTSFRVHFPILNG